MTVIMIVVDSRHRFINLNDTHVQIGQIQSFIIPFLIVTVILRCEPTTIAIDSYPAKSPK